MESTKYKKSAAESIGILIRRLSKKSAAKSVGLKLKASDLHRIKSVRKYKYFQEEIKNRLLRDKY